MVDVLYFSDREVKRKLFERVDAARRPLIVAQLRQDKYSKPPPEREPFASIERQFGDLVDVLVVADEGTIEGMWRDPVGDLGDRLFPDDRNAAYAAATGYLLIIPGRAVATVRRTGKAADDLWLVQEVLAANVPGVPPPDASRRPGHGRQPPSDAESHGRTRSRFGASTHANPCPSSRMISVAAGDPWQVLGIAPGTPLAEAKKAFRALIAQYHPDKVAHLAPEFRELADRRTREILEAWQKIEQAG